MLTDRRGIENITDNISSQSCLAFAVSWLAGRFTGSFWLLMIDDRIVEYAQEYEYRMVMI